VRESEPTILTPSLSLMLQPAARRDGPGGVDRGTAFLNRNDLPVHIDNESSAIGQIRGAKHTVQLHHVPLVIRKHRELGIQLFGPMVESRYEIAADGQDLSVRVLEFANTRLVGGEFSRSTTGKRGREER
jgi:hypothetical protein